ncbi:FtsX-like permease family protein [Streptomyces tropicalis]|uniref:FtsX-like permease family protein n=1 Tax=Streptomyces tropicalis TaxID=3034234 RepID=A0ABT6AB32_9ACTN|nr:FtsX-like permease family protein [Streptomyces tropicalis]MDF3301025.1 FtsX-like permease family protein [Streptomyces tropicalis]
MNVFRLALLNVLALRRRLVGLVVLVAVAGAVCLSALGIAARAEGSTTSQVGESVGNRSVTVDSPQDRPDLAQLTRGAEARMARIPHVRSVQHRLQVSMPVRDNPEGADLLYATTVRAALAPPVVRAVRKNLFPLRKGEVVFPASTHGVDLGAMVGRTVTVDAHRFVRPGVGDTVSDRVRVVGTYDPSWQIEGPDAAYADDASVVRWAAAAAGKSPAEYLRTSGWDQLTLVADSSAHVPGVLGAVQRMDYPAVTLQQQLRALPGVLELVKVTGRVLLGVLGLLAFTGAVTVTGALARQRAQEVGILKAVGYRSRTVLGLLVAEMAVAGAAAALLGVVLAVGVTAAAAAGLRGVGDVAPYVPDAVPLPPLPAVALLALLTVAVVGAGAVLPARRAARMSPTDAMKDW